MFDVNGCNGVDWSEDLLDMDRVLVKLFDSVNSVDSVDSVDAGQDRERQKEPPLIVVIANKIDQSSVVVAPSIGHDDLPDYLRTHVLAEDFHLISCHQNQGIDRLVDSLGLHLEHRFNAVTGKTTINDENNEPSFVTRERHRLHLSTCEEHLTSAAQHLHASNGPIELAAEDLRLAGTSIGRIGGKIDPEDILDAIFLEFCIGK